VKRINYTLNSAGYITSYTLFPIDESKEVIEVESLPKIGLSRLIGGRIDDSLPSQAFFDAQRNKAVEKFRSQRNKLLEKYDILRINVINGDIDPGTSRVYSAITQTEKQWRIDMLNFTDEITHETTEEDYPQTPQRIANL
jgi:hypothetical protein